MTTKERWLNALRCKPVDRLPFWPKLDGSYARAQRAPFTSMSNGEIHAFIGSEPPIGLPSCVKSDSAAEVEIKRSGDEEKTFVSTPVGSLSSVRRFDQGSQSWHPIEFPLKNLDDIKTLTWIAERETYDVDTEAKARSLGIHRDAGNDGATLEAVGKSALMNFVELLAGVENAHYFIEDHEPQVSELFLHLNEEIDRRIDILLEHSPADMLMMVENTSTTLISPNQYRTYSAQHITRFAEKVRRSDKAIVLHMCGYLQALLPQLERVGAHAFEAFTSPPVGNTPLSDGRLSCADVCLIGGTNAALWLQPAERIIGALEADFAKLPHLVGIIPSSAGVMPPLAPPEKIRRICEWVNSYPADAGHAAEIGIN